jgi:hypothetical protein
VLRFGNLTNVGAGDKSADAQSESETAAGDAETKPSDVHRYLFVMARLNENAVKKPELEKLPELPAGESASGESASADANAAAATTEDKPADAPADTNQADPDPANASSEENSETAGPSDATSTESSETPAENADAPKAEPASDEEAKTADTTTADTTPAAEGEAKTSESDKTKELEALVAERKLIEDENSRKQDEYNETLEKGRENVKDLNLRFGDWYFVVADDVFKKIRLGRENVIKKKEKKEEADASQSTGDAANPALPGATIPGLPPIPAATE